MHLKMILRHVEDHLPVLSTMMEFVIKVDGRNPDCHNGVHKMGGFPVPRGYKSSVFRDCRIICTTHALISHTSKVFSHHTTAMLHALVSRSAWVVLGN